MLAKDIDNNYPNMSDRLAEMKQTWETKLAMAQSLPDKYKAQKDSTIAHANSMIKMLEQRIAIDAAKKAEAESSEYKALEKFGKNLPLELLKEIDTIYKDGDLTSEQKEFLICHKGGCMPTL